MQEDYYYYDEDYGDEEGEAWEMALENAYATAKSLMDTSPEQCIAGLRSVECDDPEGGKWTFKALKMLTRVSRRTKAYDDMIKYYNRVATFSHKDVSKGALQKAMTKFIDEAERVPVEYMKRLLHITIEVTSKDMNSFGKLWFNAKLKHSTLLLESNALDDVLKEMESVLSWCKEEDKYSLKKNSQLFLAYSLLLEVYTKKRDFNRMREIFLLAISIVNTIPPSHVVGNVLECGGKVYMHLQDWPAAFRAFSVAFRNYNETGDSRRIGCLKYVVLTCMLDGSTIDPFATQETKVYGDAVEIIPVAKLWKSFTSNDVHGFLNVMAIYQEYFELDPIVYSCLDLILEQLRLKTLITYVAPYQKVLMKRLEDVLLTNSEEVERLCVRSVMEGTLHATLDDKKGIIIINTNNMQKENVTSGYDSERIQALRRWSNALVNQNERVRKEVERVS